MLWSWTSHTREGICFQGERGQTISSLFRQLSSGTVGTCRPLFKWSIAFQFFLGCAVPSASFSSFGTVVIVRELLNPAGWQGLPQVQPVVRLGTRSQQAHRHRDTCMWYVHPAAGRTDQHRHSQHSRKQPQLPYLWLIRLKDSGQWEYIYVTTAWISAVAGHKQCAQ